MPPFTINQKGEGILNLSVSIVITVLESYSIVERQIKYFKSLNLPDNIEIIFMDDGSNPPNSFPGHGLRNFNIYPTGDIRPWSQACARNRGAEIAQGKYLLMTDIDHILTREAIDAVNNFEGDKMRFTRSYAVLDKDGGINQEPEVLFRYGLSRRYYKRKGLNVRRHTNTFAMKRDIYFEIGGYDEKFCNRPKGGNKGDAPFYHRYKRHYLAGNCKEEVVGPEIHTYPGLPEDTLGLFHKLKRYEKGA